MLEKKKYKISEVTKICNISSRVLRFYDKFGLLSSNRNENNNYRLYSRDEILLVPVVKYYKLMGFKLREIVELIKKDDQNVCYKFRKVFFDKANELRLEKEEIDKKNRFALDWYNLIAEAEQVVHHNIIDVSVKWVEPVPMLFMEQMFENDMQYSIINLDWTNYVTEIGNEISGGITLNFSSIEDRIAGKEQKVRIMQRPIFPCAESVQTQLGGCHMASCYHIGPYEALPEVYKKIRAWARNHNYVLDTPSYERYLVDYWITNKSEQFVTEVLIGISREGAKTGKV